MQICNVEAKAAHWNASWDWLHTHLLYVMPTHTHMMLKSLLRHMHEQLCGVCCVGFPTHVSFLLTSSICQCLHFHFFQEKFKHVFFQVCFPFRRTWSVEKIPSGCSAFLSLIVRYFWYLYIRLFSMTSFETFCSQKEKKKEISCTCCVRMIRSDRVEPNCYWS